MRSTNRRGNALSEEKIISPAGSLVEHAKLPGKSSEEIERCVIATFRVVESMGFKGGFRHWEELLRIGGLLAL